MRLLFVLVTSLSLLFNVPKKEYQKNYFENGQLESEGWIVNNKKTSYCKFYYENGQTKSAGHYKNDLKTKYWRFYSENGAKVSEGHYIEDKKCNWWLFYDDMEKINHKCQLKNNQKNGYCLMYENEKLVAAVKYSEGKKIKTWTDYRSFRKENSLKDLR